MAAPRLCQTSLTAIDLGDGLPAPDNIGHLLLIRPLAQHEGDFADPIGGNIHVELERGDGIVSGIVRTIAQIPVLQTDRALPIGRGAKKSAARRCQTVRRSIGGKEGNTTGELAMPMIDSENGAQFRTIDALAKHCRLTRDRAQQPIGKACGRNAAGDPRAVGQFETEDFDRVVGGHKTGQILDKPHALSVPLRLPQMVFHPAGPASSGRQRRHRPDLPGFFIPQVKRFALPIAQGVIMPLRQPVFSAVAGKSKTRSSLGNDAAKIRIGKDIDPGRGRGTHGIKVNAVIPTGGKTAQAIAELERNDLLRLRQGLKFHLAPRRNEERTHFVLALTRRRLPCPARAVHTQSGSMLQGAQAPRLDIFASQNMHARARA